MKNPSGPTDPAAAGRAADSAGARDVENLAQELTDLARTEPDQLGRRIGDLTVRQQAELALRLGPAERLELLLHAPRPMRLVRSLPDSELYLTVRRVGPSDALPLLALTSARQLTHLIDLEAWRGERFDPGRAGAWVAVFLESGEPTLKRFLRSADDALLAALFKGWLHIEQVEIEDTPEVKGPGLSESGDERGGISPDGYHRLSPEIPEHAAAARAMLQVFYSDQPERYERVLTGSLWTLPAELEEEALHWRRSRLEEHGFVPWEEAMSAFAAPSGVRARASVPVGDDEDAVPVPRTALRVIDGDSVLAPAIGRLPGGEQERFLFELGSVANRVLVANAADLGDPDNHEVALRKSLGYVGIGVEMRREQGEDPGAVLASIPAIELFREGYAPAERLQGRAQALSESGWVSKHARALELLDPPLRPRVEGLLHTRPDYLVVEEGDGESFFRDFQTLGELDETRVALEMAEFLGRLFLERLDLDAELLLGGDPTGEPPRFSVLFGTMLAQHVSTGRLTTDPLPEAPLRDFLRELPAYRDSTENTQQAVSSLVGRLEKDGRLEGSEPALLTRFGRACLDQIVEECGRLDPAGPIDPRFVSSLMIAVES
ncbi:hypothetical protein ABI59_07620 [Acidobacteria bacterium Mor1]|nr:hypothetical protein ABI59_07620 [Acidobacteria bacterium Mor1]